ncbi:MAG: peptidase S41, partial [Acidobacteriota bacterium]|nr:peptidase S41 [Acidobacteriota bacterium]
MRRYLRSFLVLCLVAGTAVTGLLAGIDARMLRQPDVSDDQIAFVYAGDIWLVAKTGGQAHRISTPAGEEQFPRFSPDGEWLAFTGNYDGNQDVYVVRTRGGIPKRLTFHPMADRVLGWYPEGNAILFASGRASGKQRFNQFYRISPRGGQATKLPLPYGEFGSLASDGKQLAYTTVTRDFRTWKRYRGGTAPKIWLFDLDSKQSSTIPNEGSNDSLPMWHGDTVYFHSDRGPDRRANIWAYDTTNGTTRQITKFRDFDVRFPAIGPGDIVF